MVLLVYQTISRKMMKKSSLIRMIMVKTISRKMIKITRRVTMLSR